MVSSVLQDRWRVLIAERNPLVIAALRGLFAESTRFSIADTARTSAELCEKLGFVEVDCVLLSWQLDDAEAPDVLADLGRLGLDLRIVLFADTNNSTVVNETIRFGVNGLCYQFEDPEILFATLTAVMKGRVCVPYAALSRVSNMPSRQLTSREMELLGMLSNGWSNTQIASRTGISENTVKYHLKNVYDKLEVRNRAMAVALYARERRRKPD
ncbi:MAG: response regulator transcription factor [Mesorhizobium sp.]|uniref:response regulator transcription factor n=1 Tax=unclassified Mesorhizobium TaxID=325217 RepID=UPI000FCBB828|nr:MULTISPECIES: response regulator transcription factor [unclassified Mesorhizobium]RUV87797.1 response regulator transcription factor [Mesorhizobium sp. M5C.F.Ca.IN.020.14.1.1]RUV29689.1 response regulator transcription factor [Mesorhizobium sp. M5C.F.Ca.IN.020.32.2.1]RUV54720.1 response regulator transcription factor [Mesorhizobium sp. M5C.F.Ca.IN.020.29.1.1]RWC46562.1 MAG: response regulator transcription factor [Mesorhizobium sp.]RWD52485.1 MAG: response regulator transcription factor [Me